jgi:hypothetical protein
MRTKNFARMNPAVELARDYAVPGAVRIRSNPSGDVYAPLQGLKGAPPSVLRHIHGRRGRHNPMDVKSATGAGQHGLQLNSEQISVLLKRAVDINKKISESGGSPLPICIWGSHGLGKTTLVRSLVKNDPDMKGTGVYADTGKIAYIAPAQFEDPGDLLGLPYKEGGRTKYAKPEWVPDVEGPGILLIDDFNRADSRLLKAMMQLFQDRGLAGWKLKDGWMIVATANPSEGGEYDVSELDPAMLTRMMHVEMIFDIDVWKNWATSKKKDKDEPNVDPRAVGWMITEGKDFLGTGSKYPRTTPRTVDMLFEQLRSIPDWSKELTLVKQYAFGLLDEAPAEKFVAYARELKADELPEPEVLLSSNDIVPLLENMKNILAKDTGMPDTVRFNEYLATRFIPYVMPNVARNNSRARRNNSDSALRVQQENLLRFLLYPHFPKESLTPLFRQLVDAHSVDHEVPVAPFAQAFTLDKGQNVLALGVKRFATNADPSIWTEPSVVEQMKDLRTLAGFDLAQQNPRFRVPVRRSYYR